MNRHAPPAQVSRLQIEITTGCNLRCVGCQRTIGLEAGTWVSRQMPRARFEAVLRHAPPARALVLQGIGEPTLHPDLEDFVRLARADGRFGVVSFNTNALVRELDDYRRLREAGLGHLSVSVDSFDRGTAERLRAGTDVERLARMLGGLVGLFPRLTVSIVLSRANLEELPALLRRAAALGARVIEIQPMIRYGEQADPLCLDEADAARARATIDAVRAGLPGVAILAAPALTPDGGRCRRPLHALYVTVDGWLTPCCTTNDATQFGHTSLESQPFEAAWHAPGVAGWFDAAAAAQPSICDGCAFNPAGPGPAVMPVRAAPATTAAPVSAAAALAPAASVRPVRLVGRRSITAPGAPAPDRGDATDEIEQARRLAVDGDVPGAVRLLGRLAERAAAGDRDAAPRLQPALDALARLDADPPNWMVLANQLRVSGRPEAARALLARRLARAPDDVAARLTDAMACLTIVHADQREVVDRRVAYDLALARALRAAEGAPAPALAAAAEVIGRAKPFFLAYHADDDRALQARYGRILARLIAAAVPAPPLAPRAPAQGRRLRIGFASRFFHLHSVSKLFVGWIERLDRAGFEVIGYHLGRTRDPMCERIARACDRFESGERTTGAWRDRLLADRLDALIYPELGMDDTAVRLACQRLAPVQCVAWGHPVTTGLPTIDWFLSSDRMEPADAERHYTETLVRLPGLSICYDPMPGEGGTLTRRDLGLREDAVVYVCCQALYKYLPREDAVLIAIARRIPAAQFLFIAEPGLPATEVFRTRLRRAFAHAGLEPDRHLRLVAPVPFEAFPSFLRAGDVYLDSIGWSGGNTTLEAIACERPIVTMPTALMRGRHSAAILAQMGLPSHVSADRAGYVARAVALADPAERAAARDAIVRHRDRLYRDPEPVRALESFLRRACLAADGRPTPSRPASLPAADRTVLAP